MLYDARAHESLVGDLWDAERVRAGIRAIVAGAVAAADPQMLWPAAEWDAWMTEAPLANLYVGAAGVVWALDVLGRTGHGEVDLDLGVLARRALARFRERPDYGGWPVPVPEHAAASLWLGESGILLVAWKLDPSPDLADSLLARVRENVDNDADDVMWGTPGTMLAAHALYEGTGEERWADARRVSAAALLGRRGGDGLWTQHLYGESFQGLSASHGFAGIVQALARSGERVADAGGVAARHVIVEDGLANWPDAAGRELRSRDGEIRVQWDTGAPGIVTALGDSLDEELALAAGELVWRAGPLRKGPMLCHGTSGNGLAFLRLFRRTGDELWLDRARRFAVHALAQVAASPPRYSLWTGGVGVALYLARCLDGDPTVPVIDLL